MENTALWEQQAVKAAMEGAWNQAIELNQKILKTEPRNTAALNRLARALWETGNLTAAKKTYQQALTIDPHNVIARKNLNRLADQKKSPPQNQIKNRAVSSGIFLEESGKTKVVKLIRLTSPEILSEQDSGHEVRLVPKPHSLSITTLEGEYLGALPDDLSHRLLRFIKGGNQYQAFIKAVDRQNLEIFIREIKRASKFNNLPSFSSPLISANNFPPE